MKAPIPIFRSFDEELTRAFYLEFLGFDLVFEHRFEPGTPLYMGVQQGAFELHLSEHFGDATPGAAVRVEVDDVHEMAERLNAKAYKFARPGVQRQDWGWDELIVKDPSGNRLVFCTPIPD